MCMRVCNEGGVCVSSVCAVWDASHVGRMQVTAAHALLPYLLCACEEGGVKSSRVGRSTVLQECERVLGHGHVVKTLRDFLCSSCNLQWRTWACVACRLLVSKGVKRGPLRALQPGADTELLDRSFLCTAPGECAHTACGVHACMWVMMQADAK